MTEVVARWANMSLDERIAERLTTILFAADEIRDMVVLAGKPSSALTAEKVAEQVQELAQSLLPPLTRLADASIERDPELEELLVKLDIDLSQSCAMRGNERDRWREQIEREAAPYALAFYYEIRRMDSIGLATRTLATAQRDISNS